MRSRWTQMTTSMALAAACIAIASGAYTQGDTSDQGAEEAFQLLFERNIFDPDRSPMQTEEPEIQEEVAPSAPEDYLRLVGILISDDTAIAFFDGSRPEYVTALFLDEYLGDLFLTEANTTGVVFYHDGEDLPLAVGAALARSDGGAWHGTEVRESISSDAEAKTDTGEKSVDATKDDAGGDLLERLRKRREQELGNE